MKIPIENMIWSCKVRVFFGCLKWCLFFRLDVRLWSGRCRHFNLDTIHLWWFLGVTLHGSTGGLFSEAEHDAGWLYPVGGRSNRKFDQGYTNSPIQRWNPEMLVGDGIGWQAQVFEFPGDHSVFRKGICCKISGLWPTHSVFFCRAVDKHMHICTGWNPCVFLCAPWALV